jgi:ribosomal protein S27E
MRPKSNQSFRVGMKYGCYDILDISENNGSFCKSYFKVRCNSCGTIFEHKSGAALARKPNCCINCKGRFTKRTKLLKIGDIRGKFTILDNKRKGNNQILVRCNKCGWTGYTNIVNIYHVQDTKRKVGCKHVDSKSVSVDKE